MKKQIRLAIVTGLLLQFGTVQAAESTSSITTINFLNSYNQYGPGDVIFRLTNPTGDCTGYWITKADAGFQANMAMLLAAYEAKTPVTIDAYNDQLWHGSTNPYCKLYDIEYH